MRTPSAGTPYVLGLDVGVASIGWTLVGLDQQGEPCRILLSGVHTFEAGVEGDVESGRDEARGAARRQARLSRRMFWRRQRRRRKILRLLQHAGLLPPGEIRSPQAIHDYLLAIDAELRRRHASDGNRIAAHVLPYRLRAAALDRALDLLELGRAFYHLAQRRGFLSNRKSIKKDEDEGVVKKGISDLQAAMEAAGARTLGGVKLGETPIQHKAALVAQLRQAIAETKEFCTAHGVDLDAIQAAKAFERVRLLDDAVDAILATDDDKRRFLVIANTVSKLYKAILPDPAANELAPVCTLLAVIAQKIRSLAPPVDISEVMGAVEEVLDESIAAEGYVIRPAAAEGRTDHVIDLSQLDFDRLRKKFEEGRKRIETEKLRAAVGRKLQALVRLNRTRLDYLEKFQQMIEEYNSGAINVEVLFDRLVQFAQELTEEEQRSIAERLTEEELAIFDLLTKPDMTLRDKEQKQVKKVARELLVTLKQQKLVLDWRKRQQSRAAVRLAIEQALDKLPPSYTREIYQQKCEAVFQHVFDAYSGAGQSVYAQSA